MYVVIALANKHLSSGIKREKSIQEGKNATINILTKMPALSDSLAHCPLRAEPQPEFRQQPQQRHGQREFVPHPAGWQ